MADRIEGMEAKVASAKEEVEGAEAKVAAAKQEVAAAEAKVLAAKEEVAVAEAKYEATAEGSFQRTMAESAWKIALSGLEDVQKLYSSMVSNLVCLQEILGSLRQEQHSTSAVTTSDNSGPSTDSKLRYIKKQEPGASGEINRLFYGSIPLSCTTSQKQDIKSLVCTHRYEKLCDGKIWEGLKFDDCGGMAKESIDNLQETLEKTFDKGYFNQRNYRVSFGLLAGKHVSATDQEMMGEMFFQQFVYNLFSGLLLSACGTEAKNYKADELVTASLPCMYCDTPTSDWQDGNFRIKPDAASTMNDGCDPFAMMELKPPKPSPEDVLFDQEKCIALLSSTLISMDRHQVRTSELCLPFIIGQGYDAYLYIVRLEQNSETKGTGKIPKVIMVGDYYDLKVEKKRGIL